LTIWALGLVVGINLITSGWAIVMAAYAGRRVAKAFMQPISVVGQ